MEGSSFVEEIDHNELQDLEVIGRGAFGVVSRARWRNIDVAVKRIETETERKAFVTELKQLSRVHHPNIVTLYGACTKPPMVCLVMEYAEGGSLYNVLHGVEPQPSYTLGHAMSWCLQCALGVEYLHGMKPRPLIHRDLKPPNLLLISNGTKLKICDFGTACDAHTYMTNNKGSAAWMAPEVFEGSKYSEKCDVFSWGIILWEVLTRLKPFDEIGAPAFRIMWAVHNGHRPPLIADCPKAIQKLMTRCWAANPMDRPSINEVVRIMSVMKKFCKGGEQPLIYPSQETEVSGTSLPSGVLGSVYDTPPPTNPTSGTNNNTAMHALRDTMKKALVKAGIGEPVPVIEPVTPTVKPVVIEDDNTNWRRTSAPASLAASRENLLDKSSRSSTPSIEAYKRYSADLSKLADTDFLAFGAAVAPNITKSAIIGHRRTGSHGTPHFLSLPNTHVLAPNWLQPVSAAARVHKRTGSHGNTPFKPSDNVDVPMTHSQTVPADLSNTAAVPHMGAGYGAAPAVGSWTPASANQQTAINLPPNMSMEQMLDNMAHIHLDYQLQPLPPCESCPESMQIYNEHVKLAEKFCRIQLEIKLLEQRNKALQQELEEDEQLELNNMKLVEEYERLVAENENLNLLKINLKKAIDDWKREHEKDTNSQNAQLRHI